MSTLTWAWAVQQLENSQNLCFLERKRSTMIHLSIFVEVNSLVNTMAATEDLMLIPSLIRFLTQIQLSYRLNSWFPIKSKKQVITM